MKEPFEDKGFEDLIRQRLQDLEASPDEDFDKELLAKLKRPGAGFTFSRKVAIAALILLLLGFFYPAYKYINGSYSGAMQETSEMKEKDANNFTSGKHNALIEADPAKKTDKNQVKRVIDTTIPEKGLSESEQSTVFTPQIDESRTLDDIWFLENYSVVSPDNTLLLPLIPSVKNREIDDSRALIEKKPKKVWGIYGDMLTFWTYQQAFPNQNDDWIVSAMENSGLLSTDRMGGKFDIGIYYGISKNMEIFGGMSSQVQQFRSEFEVRSLSPSNIEYSESTGAFIPQYENEYLKVNEKLWSAGGRIGVRYYLPYADRKFWFAPSMDYQRMINRVKTHGIRVPENQVYLNLDFGWSHQVSPHLFFKFSPALSYSLLQQSVSDATISLKPFSWGINLGLNYRMGK